MRSLLSSKTDPQWSASWMPSTARQEAKEDAAGSGAIFHPENDFLCQAGASTQQSNDNLPEPSCMTLLPLR